MSGLISKEEIMASRSIGTDLTQGNVRNQLLKFSVPFMLASLLQTIYGTVDAVVVGHFVGADGLSAVSTCGELTMLFTFVAVGFGGAGQTLIGQYIGANKREELNKTIGTLFTMFLIIAVVLSIFSIFMVDVFLNLLNVPEEAFADGHSYFLVCSYGFIFIFGYNLISSIMRGMGDSKRPLIFIAIASAMNLILDLLFVAVLGMGTAGAALATILGQGFSFLCSMIYLYRHKETFGFDFKLKSFIPEKSKVLTLIKLGTPMTAQGVLISITMLFVISLVNNYGVAASAANGIGMKLQNITRIVTTSMSTAGAAMIAQNVGAKRYDRAFSVFKWAMVITVGFSVLVSVISLLFPKWIFSLFNTDEDVIAYASTYMIFFAIDSFSAGFRSPCNSMVNGTGAAMLGLTASVFDGILARIGLSLLFGNLIGMGVSGYWLGGALAGYVSVIMLLPYCLSGRWKKKDLIKSGK